MPSVVRNALRGSNPRPFVCDTRRAFGKKIGGDEAVRFCDSTLRLCERPFLRKETRPNVKGISSSLAFLLRFRGFTELLTPPSPRLTLLLVAPFLLSLEGVGF